MHEIEQKQTHVVYLLFSLGQYMSAFCVFQSSKKNIYRRKSGVDPFRPQDLSSCIFQDLMFQTHSPYHMRSWGLYCSLAIHQLQYITDKATQTKRVKLLIKFGDWWLQSSDFTLYVPFPGVFNPPLLLFDFDLYPVQGISGPCFSDFLSSTLLKIPWSVSAATQ